MKTKDGKDGKMKTQIAVTIAAMLMFLVVGLTESRAETFGQLGGSSRYSPSNSYTGGHQFKRNLIGSSQNSSGKYSRSSNTGYTGYSRSKYRSYRGYSRNSRLYIGTPSQKK